MIGWVSEAWNQITSQTVMQSFPAAHVIVDQSVTSQDDFNPFI
jgi:hypothetical protein